MDIVRFCRRGLVDPFAPRKKEWIGAVLSLAGGLGAQLLGQNAAAKKAKEAEAKQRAEEASEGAYSLRRKEQKYADTAAGQALVNRAKTQFDANAKRERGIAAVSGATPATSQMAKDSANKAMAQVYSDLAAQDTARQDRADEQHRAAQSRFAQMDIARDMQKAQNITNATQQASNAIMSAASALGQSSKGTTNFMGGSNNGIDFTPAQVESPSQPTPTPMEMYRNASAAEQEHFRRAVMQ